ncbi:MAG: N-methyl-L-tryptophan oxidase [Phycisphaerae bacterium]|jgi:sarcosine oxidase
MQRFDAIVIGMGVMGAAATYSLTRRGARVLGLEQFHVAHDRGSSHGRTRICRRAYFEHPDYVPLASRAFGLWDALGAAAGELLFDRCGLILSGRPDGVVVPGVRRAAAEYGLDIQTLSPSAAAANFEGFAFPPLHEVLYEADAGLLHAERCVEAFVRLARDGGAEVREREALRSWHADACGVRVETEHAAYTADALILAAGAWSTRLLASLGLPLRVLRKVQLWFVNRDARYRRDRGCPVYGFEMGDRFYYGFPEVDSGEIKIAEHTGEDASNGPEQLDRSLRPTDADAVRAFVAAHLPGVGAEVVRHAVCMYTMTPDGHFVIDRHPQHERVWLACGFSGHGFKFAPVVGVMLADALERGSRAVLPALFSCARFPLAASGRT